MNKEELKKNLKDLYELYRFRLERETESLFVFSYSAGFFYNAEIVLLEENDIAKKKAEEIKNEYQEIQYSNVIIRFYESVEVTRDRLFASFFYVKDSRRRLQREYNEFCQKKTERLLDEYVYIPCRYRNEKGEQYDNLVDNLVKSADNKVGRLTILEAAAGYGKTCTAYEILRAFLDCQKEKIPLMIELSKNRTARVFRHVLNDEIDRKFTQLSSETVVSEIKNGRLPLIIDGFDELIEYKTEKKTQDTEEKINENSLTLLSTIAELLGDDSQAWILLTTRSSAIFTGDIFDEWIISHLGKQCSVSRIQIQEPSLKEWIAPQKYSLLQQSNINMEELSNPVLLTFLRNANPDEFEDMVQSSDKILKKYFSLLLTRELERQNLEFTEDELHTVMKKLAAYFVRFDMKSETIEFIQDLLQEILKDDLLRYRVRYKEKHLSEEGILSADEYVKRVSHNYLLDRVSPNSDQISFINEFIFGILVGDAVRDNILNGEELYERFIDMSTTAFAVRGDKIREEYYDKIKGRLLKASDSCRLNAEIGLLQKIDSDYSNGYVRGLYVKCDVNLCAPHKFVNYTFDTCTFDRCRIDAEIFVDCRFVNCQFYDVKIEGTPNQNLIFMGGAGYEKLYVHHDSVTTGKDVDDYEKLVLEQFWKRGSERAEMRRTYTALFRGTKSEEQMKVQNAINSLVKRGLISELNICYELNTTHMSEINYILGRR
jgi:hypothetical protein